MRPHVEEVFDFFVLFVVVFVFFVVVVFVVVAGVGSPLASLEICQPHLPQVVRVNVTGVRPLKPSTQRRSFKLDHVHT